MEFDDDTICEGEWKDNLMHGKGVLKFNDDGTTCEGGFEYNQYHGTVKVTGPDGSFYEVVYVRGQILN